MADYNIFNQYQGKAAHALIGWVAGWQARPILAPPNMWWKGRVMEFSGAKPEMRIPLPVHAPKVRHYTGSPHFDKGTGVFLTAFRKMYDIGASASVIELGEYDFRGWSMQPDSMATAIGNIPGNNAADLINGNTGEKVVSARANTTWWSGDNGGAAFACLSGDTNKIPVNPFNKKILNKATGLATWYNGHENFAITGPNIITALKNMQVRPGFDGMPLDYGRDNVEMWVPSLAYEEARQLVEVFQQLAGSGVVSQVEVTIAGGSNAGQNQVIYGSQQNAAYGRVKVIPVPQLRSDMWCLVNPTTLPGSEIFLRVMGGSAGNYGVNPAAYEMSTNESVPHVWTVVHGEQSPMFYQEQRIGIWNLINEGMALASPYAIEFCYTGAAS